MAHVIREILSLVVIAALITTALALVHAQTAPRIEAARLAQEWQAVANLLDGAARTTFEAQTLDGQKLAWRALNTQVAALSFCDETRVLRAIEAGYGGELHVLAAVTPAGLLAALGVSRHSETPGLGDFIDGPWLQRFVGADQDGVQHIDNVSGATITTNAVRRGLQNLLTAAAALDDCQAPAAASAKP